MTIDLLSPTTLRTAGTGALHLPGDPGYDAARLAWSCGVDQRPAAVATPTSAAEVAAVVRAARAAGLQVAPQSTGHNPGPLAAQGLDDVVLVRTGAMNDVQVDPDRLTARVGGGTVWLPAVEAAAAHGLATLHGSSPDVGIAGYSLGGGLGWYARKLGLAANSLTAVELVTADGALVRTDAQHDPDLFWALRGGGGGFGVVTALEFGLYPIATAYAGFLLWDAADAEQVLRTWSAWAPGAPDEVTTAFRMMKLPPLPELPDFLRGRHIAIIDGAVLGTDERARAILGELRALRPEVDTFARVPAASLARLHMDPEEPTPLVSGTAMLGSFPDAAVDAFLAEVGPGSTSSLMMAELRQLGGAVGRRHEGGGALDRFVGDFLAFGGGLAATPEMAAAGQADADALMSALAGWANGRNYLNFAEDAIDPRTGYDVEAWHRLTAIRSVVDPDELFVPNHPIGRAVEDDVLV
ncbi:FAD-binding oxidoreductase [Georgenia muralis]|uniref:FAD/FMN-containing dehydrogenase n=1 Tax=Georgenia muralis TaxID=154117 RepID=A0A3N4ZUG4_9MICO|nr:FAD-binding protein [Georgenia muralis]RPF29122.1 FAD/FMN-containing dehydrogenase [Georgenia muralis]